MQFSPGAKNIEGGFFMKCHFMLIPMIACTLAACQPEASSFYSQRNPSIEKSLANENGIPENDVFVKVSSQKAHYVRIEFKCLPPDACFKLNSSIRYGEKGPQPHIIHIKIPGGDVTNLLAEPECRSITKTGKVPILCRKLPVGRMNQNPLKLKNFSPEDLLAIAPKIPLEWNRRIIELEPEDGIVDWAVIARFPETIAWRFCNVRKWLNTKTSNVASDRFSFDGGSLELPAEFSVKKILIAKDVELSEQLRLMLVNKAKKHVLPKDRSDPEQFEF